MSALHRVLIDFDAERSPPPRAAWARQGREPAPFAAPEAGLFDLSGDLSGGLAGGALDEDAALAASADRIAEAVAAALAEAEAAHAAALAALVEQQAADLAEARRRWVEEQGQVLADGLKAAVAMLEEALAEGAGAVLEPLVGQTVSVAAVAELRRAVADLVLSGTGGRIAVSGPDDLVAALRAALVAAGIETAGLDFTPSDTTEISVTVDTSTIETRLGAWAGTLQTRLGDDA